MESKDYVTRVLNSIGKELADMDSTIFMMQLTIEKLERELAELRGQSSTVKAVPWLTEAN